MSEESPHFDVRCYGPAARVELADWIWPCYDEVFGDFHDFETWRDDMFARHAMRSGYRLGRGLHDTLLDGISQRALLSTVDDIADPAVQLFLSSCWRKLGILRPGTQVMGRASAQ